MFARGMQTKQILTPTTFLFGGMVSTVASSVIQTWDNTTCSTHGTTLPSNLSNAGCASINNTAFLFGGNAKNTIIRHTTYSVSTDATTLSSATSNAGASNISQTLYYFGGILANGTKTSTIQSYNGTTRANGGNTYQPSTFDNSVVSLSNIIFLFGELPAASSTNRIQRFTGSNTTNETSVLSIAENDMSVSVLNSDILIFGGVHYVSGSGTLQNLIQRYNGTTLSVDIATLTTPQTGSCSSTNSNLVSIFGGNYSGNLNTIQTYDGSTITLSSATLSSNRTHMSSTTLNVRSYS